MLVLWQILQTYLMNKPYKELLKNTKMSRKFLRIGLIKLFNILFIFKIT